MVKQAAALALMLAVAAAVCFRTAYAEVYLTQEQALELVFGGKCAPLYEPRPLDDALKGELKKARAFQDEQDQFHFYRCPDSSSYALIDSEVGKHKPITYIVGIDAKGTVTRVDIMVFREIRGWEVRERGFIDQYAHKGKEDPLNIGKEIRNVSGATFSAKAISKGVKRALLAWNYFYGGRSQ